ncbi:hypothetical protein B0J13DRAFT_521404 [Dactylonectria estremocensis]|uniref:Uncharacterized protein n=1 Tax=Dactylonectria estremocensis TaxID=1079267 RepID=A0A9P9F6Q2_9HYPO|nr:hypothetical protein B0J13DRAFT_521404 [Dactylonectria estremocensis]
MAATFRSAHSSFGLDFMLPVTLAHRHGIDESVRALPCLGDLKLAAFPWPDAMPFLPGDKAVSHRSNSTDALSKPHAVDRWHCLSPQQSLALHPRHLLNQWRRFAFRKPSLIRVTLPKLGYTEQHYTDSALVLDIKKETSHKCSPPPAANYRL